MKSLKALIHLNTMTFSGLQMLLFAFIPFLAEKSQLSLANVVASFSFGSLLFLFSSPYWATKSDQWGRAPILCLGTLGLGVSTALLWGLLYFESSSALGSASALWISRLIYGLTASAIVPVAQAFLVDLNPADSMRALLSNSMSLNLGRALGPAYIVFAGSQDFAFLLQGALIWTLVVAAAWAVYAVRIPAMPRNNLIENKGFLNFYKKNHSLRALFLLALLFTSFVGVLNFSLALILQKNFSLPSNEAGLLMAQVLLFSAFLALFAQALGKALLKNRPRGALILGAAGLLIGALALNLMTNYVGLAIAIGFLSVGMALLPPSYLDRMYSGRNSQRGLLAGFMGSINTLGFTLGGLLAAGSLKTQLVSLEALLIILVFGLSVLLGFILQTEKREVADGLG